MLAFASQYLGFSNRITGFIGIAFGSKEIEAEEVQDEIVADIGEQSDPDEGV
jgi:hypothetical protein